LSAKQSIFRDHIMNSKTVGIIGASGWLGGHLAKKLLKAGWEVVGFSRSERPDNKIRWRQWAGKGPVDLSGVNAVINLAGEAIDQRWTAARKVAFRESRVDLSETLCESIRKSEVRVLLNGSATGFYGERGDEQLPESSSVGEGYLAGLCRDWEGAVDLPSEVRTVFLRTGVVLGKGGRAWNKMRGVFKWGIGGRLGNGKQWMPWIHLEDEIEGIIFCLENEISGPVNLVAPKSVRNALFTEAVGKVLRRPTLLPAPAFALKLALGEFAEEGLLASSRVIPAKLKADGFKFKYPTIDQALAEIESDG
jgi:uncharacterized protein (TIGR01777 family)